MQVPGALEEAVVSQQIRLASNDGDLAEICHRLCQLNGFSHFSILKRADDNPDAPGWVEVLGNSPEGLKGALAALLSRQAGIQSVSLLKGAAPFCLMVDQSDDPDASRLFEAGLKYNLLFKVKRAAASNGILCFSGERHAASEMELMSLQFHSMLVYDRLTELAESEAARKGGELSPRELECLRWIAKGKTSSEIGIILSLSENTINNYIVNACRKIGAVNRIHAVYLALKRELIP